MVRRPILSWCLGILMLVLWSYARKEWSGQTGNFRVAYTRTTDLQYDAAQFGGGVTGSSYFIGGTFVLILGACWMILPQFKRIGIAEAPALVPLGAAVLGVVALGRWLVDFNEKSDAMRATIQRTVHYSASDASRASILCVIALVILSIIYWLRGRKGALVAAPPPLPNGTPG